MTTQDIYAWVQMGLRIVIGGGIVVGISRYFGILRRAIESQKATIEAQAEQMKAQSTVLQDVERLNKVMQQVVAFFDPQAQLQREQAYKARVERDMDEMRSHVEPMLEILEAMTSEVLRVRALFEAGCERAKFRELEIGRLHEEEKNRDHPHLSPGHEPTAGAKADGDGDDQP
jgi:uncharacterized membrane protein YgaE (UPF0421/DUF939 family)